MRLLEFGAFRLVATAGREGQRRRNIAVCPHSFGAGQRYGPEIIVPDWLKRLVCSVAEPLNDGRERRKAVKPRSSNWRFSENEQPEGSLHCASAIKSITKLPRNSV